jgi:hypothetical protein
VLDGLEALTVTLVTVSVVDMFVGLEDFCCRLTVPAKPPVLVTIIVVFVEVVAFILMGAVMLPRVDVIVKSGGGTMTLTLTEFAGRVPLFPVIVIL